MEKVQMITGSRLSEITSQEFIIRKQSLGHENYMVQEHIMEKQGMKLLKAYNKSPLVTLSQKGSENTIASM